MMQEANIEETQKMIEVSGLDIIASGGISTLEDLRKVEAIGATGAIIGKALYIGSIQLEEAVQLFEGGYGHAE